MYRYNPENVGEFTEVSFGSNFTYRKTKDAWALSQGLQYEIDLFHMGSVAFANIKKTVAYVAVDEAADGSAVLEKWLIKKHVIFVKE